MAHRRVRDLMTTEVRFVSEDTPYQTVAEQQAEWQVSSLPVVDAANRVVGVVSEADLLPKVEYGTQPHLTERLRHPASTHKAAGVVVGDVMTRPGITIPADASLTQAARMMDRGRLRMLPVVDAENRLIGVISRRDLLRVFLRSDEDIRREIQQDVFGELLGVTPPAVVVSVTDGVVTLSGQLDDRSMIPVALRLVHGVDGVVDVVSHLGFAIDDLRGYEPSASAFQAFPEGPAGREGWAQPRQRP